jgi:hypothetical protein
MERREGTLPGWLLSPLLEALYALDAISFLEVARTL